MTLRQGILHALAIGISSFVTRYSVPQKLLNIFLKKTPSESLVFGIVFILFYFILFCFILFYLF